MKVFYNKKQTAKNCDSFSPSAGKPEKVVEVWKKLGIGIEIIDFKPATREQFYLAHDKKYIDDLLDRKISNGFGNRSEEVAKSLPYTTGSMVAAALHALKTGETSASPTSGFHHACYDSGGGFCSANGLIVAAQVCKKVGAKKVGILDIDEHYGNGTDNIIEKLGLDYISHWTLGGHPITPENADLWLEELPSIIEEYFSDCDVLLYQAGADPHVLDPLGGRLTTEQLRRRDQIVFETCLRLSIPVAFNLAGGYQSPIEKVLEIHINTALECAKVEVKNDKEKEKSIA
jgi:acetoin utilization deacetylase AcuC-like enzyme